MEKCFNLTKESMRWQQRRTAGWPTEEGLFAAAKPLSPHTHSVDNGGFTVKKEMEMEEERDLAPMADGILFS